ncbi:PE-PPE domain-containing protein [Mycolicibacterium baixiangningiae]|uniref:PE-PPE domain-containing protein n=1 Tax=Mycolicibacterium baixiangningiae TaxID=2761578 RepID=UPI001868159D|nr:PE-PPE domain-containing protein [Mycolicibacterium baixiangningiae]
MRGFGRSLLITVVAVLGAAVLTIGSTLTGAVAALANPVALIMGNSGRPWPEESYVANAMRRYIEPNSTCGEVSCEARNVYGPEEFWPVYGGLTALTFNQSTDAGLEYLDAALQQQLHDAPDDNVVIFGYSQSGRITNLMLRRLADPDYAEGNDNIVPDADQLEIVLVGNWSRPNGGIGSRFNGITVPFLDITFDGPTPTDTGYRMTDISYEYDIISDAPLYPANLLATANAVLGFFYAHLTYADPSATSPAFPWGSNSEASFEELLASGTVQKYPGKGDDPNGNPEEWDNTYVLIPSTHLPLLQPIRDIGAATGTSAVVEPLMRLIEPTLKVLIDTGYDRTIPMGQNTPARLIPRIDPTRLTADLVEAVGKGVHDALGIESDVPDNPSDDTDIDTTLRAARTVADKPFAKPAKVKGEDETSEPAEDSSDSSSDPADNEDEVSGDPEQEDVDRELSEPAENADNADNADNAQSPATTPHSPTSESADADHPDDSTSKSAETKSTDRAAREADDDAAA